MIPQTIEIWWLILISTTDLSKLTIISLYGANYILLTSKIYFSLPPLNLSNNDVQESIQI